MTLTDKQIKDCGRQWKEALGIDPYRLYADKDFMAGATWVNDLLTNKQNNMETINIKKEELEELYKISTDEGKKMLSKYLKPENIMDKVFDLESACIEIGEDFKTILPYPNPKNKRQFRANDNVTLDVIHEALIEKWIADWDDDNQKKWCCWIKKVRAGWVFVDAVCYYASALTAGGSRLVFPTEELAEYFFKITNGVFNRLICNDYGING